MELIPPAGETPNSAGGVVWSWMLEFVQTMDATRGLKPFPDYPFARRLIEGLFSERILLVAKSRQMLATWTVAAATLYRSLYEAPGVYLFLSKGARDSKELLKRLRIIARNLPEDIGAGIKVNAEEAIFPSGSRIVSLPATEFAPRMYSPRGVFWDEMAFTPNAEDIWTSLKPAIDSGGSFVGVSTPNGADGLFHRLISDPDNGFGKLKLHYSEHPARDDSWLAEAKRGLSLTRWKQEYEIDFDVLADRVFEEFHPDRHIVTNFDPKSRAGRIYRGIDFGYRHPYVVWVHQTPDGELTLFDEWEGEGQTLDQLADAIRLIDGRNGITEADVVYSACDPAGASRTDAGVSATDRLGGKGFKLYWKTSQILDGVDLIKSLLLDAAGATRLRFSHRAEKTIRHLRSYRRETGTDKPLKDDIHDHAVDALRYLIVSLCGKRPKGWSGAKVMGVGR